MAVTKTDPTFEGKRITLLDGTKERIVKVMKTGYKTEGGTKIKPSNIGKKGRGLVELDGDGSGATPKTSSTTRKRGSNTSKQSEKGTSTVAKKATNSANMGRRELVSELVNAEVFRVRADAKGVGIDELREMVDNIGKKGTKKTSGKKSTGKSTGKSASSKKSSSKKAEQEEAKPKRQRRGKKSSEDASEKGSKVPRRGKKAAAQKEEAPAKSKKSTKKSGSVKAKPVKSITEELARSVEAALGEHVSDFIRKSTGHNFTVACVGGVFNDERLTMQIGLLPTNASDEDIEAYAADMEDAEQKATSSDKGSSGETRIDMLRNFVDESVVSDSKLEKITAAWDANFESVIEPKLGDEVEIGTKLDYEGEEAIVIGFSDAKSKIMLYLTDSESVKLVSVAKVVRMEILDDEEPEPEDADSDEGDEGEDEEDFDDEEEDDDSEEDDSDDDEEEDFDEEEDDEDDLEDTEEDDDDSEEDDEDDDSEEDDDDSEEDEEDDDEDEDSEEDEEDDDFDDFDDEL